MSNWHKNVACSAHVCRQVNNPFCSGGSTVDQLIHPGPLNNDKIFMKKDSSVMQIVSLWRDFSKEQFFLESFVAERLLVESFELFASSFSSI